MQLFGIAARGGDGNMPRFFCTVCNYPAYDEFNMSLHNESKDHKQKVRSIASLCLYIVTNSVPLKIWSHFGLFSSWLRKSLLLKQRIARAGREIHRWMDLFNEINKKQSLERAPMELDLVA